jgi:L-arabinose transport system substrate-binding protein
MKKISTLALVTLLTFTMAGAVFANGPIKIGFLVKMPEEPWFQNEWKFADQAGKEMGFEVVKIGATDGEKVLAAIDNLAAQGAQGFVICTPDTKLGPSIVQKAKADNLKVMSVDDRFIGPDGKVIESVPHMGISATKIGELVGQAIVDEMKVRGWKASETGAISVSFYELQTAKERSTGAISVLNKNAFPAAMIFDAPQKTTDTEGGFNAANVVLTKHPTIKHWVIFGVNDETVMGAVRATEGRGFKAADVIGVGIGGSGTADVEFQKADPTGFFATVLISPKRHGYETAANMYNWIKNGKEPEKLILTAGALMNRSNEKAVMTEMGL